MNPYSGMDVEKQDRMGLTALHKACLVGDWEACGQLIEAGASLYTKDAKGRDASWFVRVHLKASRHLASQALKKGGGVLRMEDSDGISDAEAKQIGTEIFKASAQAAQLPVDEQ